MKRLLIILIIGLALVPFVHAEICKEFGEDGTVISEEECETSSGTGSTTPGSGGDTTPNDEPGGDEIDDEPGAVGGGGEDVTYLERAPTTNLLVAQGEAHLCGQFWNTPTMDGLVTHNFCDIVETQYYDPDGEGITNLENTRFVCTLIGGEWRWTDMEGTVQSIAREDDEGEPTRNWINLTLHPDSYGDDVQALIDDTSIEGIGCGETGAQALVTKYSPPEGDSPKKLSSYPCLNDHCYYGGETEDCSAIGETSANGRYTCTQLGSEAAWVSDVTELAQAMLDRPADSGKHILNCGPRATAINKPQDAPEAAYCELIKLDNDGTADTITVGVLFADEEDTAGLERVYDEYILMYPAKADDFDAESMGEEDFIEVGPGYAFFTTKDALDGNSLLDNIIDFFADFFDDTKMPAEIHTTTAEQIFLVIDDQPREYAVEYRDERCRSDSADQRVIVSRVNGAVQSETCYTVGKWRAIIQDREALA